jgi:3-oxoacyl-[acyl-carrier-protein] synthase-3
MAVNSRIYSRFVSTGFYLPEGRITNEELSEVIGLTPEEIFKRCGITERRKAGAEETPVYMGVKALEEALSHGNKKVSDIERIIVATSSLKKPFPSIAVQIADKLGIGEVPGYDIYVACAASCHLIDAADSYITSGKNRAVAIVGVERMRDITRMNDKNTTILFGDGAGAAILEACSEPGVLANASGADGSLAHILTVDDEGYMVMNGRAVYEFAAKLIPKLSHEILGKAEVDIKELKLIVPHQANQRITMHAAGALGVGEELLMSNIASYGNTSAASVFIALDEAIKEKRISRNDLVLLLSFGAGVCWAANLVRY